MFRDRKEDSKTPQVHPQVKGSSLKLHGNVSVNDRRQKCHESTFTTSIIVKFELEPFDENVNQVPTQKRKEK
jgi:hypothetical protein